MTQNGIVCNMRGRKVCLDPKNVDPHAINFVSHAHADHLPSGGKGTILASSETAEIARLRGVRMHGHMEQLDGFEMVDAGHVLGARGLLFDDVFYTGDICTRDRGFLRGARVPKCKTLITECTFGLAEFAFPDIGHIQRQVNGIVSDLYGRGIPVILLGYPLGKAQTLAHLFGHWSPMFVHDSILEMNLLHKKLGVNLPDATGHTEAEKNGLLEKKPWIMLAPKASSRTKFLSEMVARHGAVTIGFSGWAQSRRFPFARGTDHSFQLSDHCDFDELVDMVVASGANQVYTVHGFVEEFAEHLRGMGISAQPLDGRTR